MLMSSSPGTDQLWAALGGDPTLLDRVRYTHRAVLPARLPVRELARSTVAGCALAAGELAARRAGGPVPRVYVDDGAVAAAFASERLVRVNGRAPVTFAPLSRFWRTADGWLRTHANYPHHRVRLLAALSLPDTGDDVALAERTAAELATRPAREAAEAVYAAGGLAVPVWSRRDWLRHAQGGAVAAAPLLERERLGTDAAARPALTPVPALPAAGLRVLDLTRVIAGPVATRTLALLGADVLRVDAPDLPENDDTHADTGVGKRSVLLDLTARADRDAFEELLSAADVVVSGYRPGALDRFGLAPEALAERRPGVVIGQLNAWGWEGPWQYRRGFDSLVQAASGIAVSEADPDGRPGALPVQALDHGTGYLLAAAILRAVTEQYDAGGARLVRVALSRTAGWLSGGPTAVSGAADSGGDAGVGAWLTETDGPLGRVRHAASPIRFDQGPTGWAQPVGPWGGDMPLWKGAR